MVSYEKKSILGFRHTEWGPDAVENFCNINEDNLHNFLVAGIYVISLLTIGGILYLIL